MFGMNENEQGEKTYRMEWIALIDRHLEVSLELIKRCYLRGRGKRIKDDVISKTEGRYRMTLKANNHCQQPPVCLTTSNAAFIRQAGLHVITIDYL